MRWIRLFWFGLDVTAVILFSGFHETDECRSLLMKDSLTEGCHRYIGRHIDTRITVHLVNAETSREDKALCGRTKEQRPVNT